MSNQEFSGKVALVTGGSRGIGRAVCLTLADAGAAVAVNYQSDQDAAHEVRRLIEDAGGRCSVFQADVTEPPAVEAMVTAVERDLGPVDLLVTSAGISKSVPHTELDFELWQRTMAVNVDGTFLTVMAVKDGMIKRGFGRIVCIASIAGLAARGTMIPYSVSKAAVIALTRSCADAFAPSVRVNGVAPGLIETDMTANMNAATRRARTEEAFLKRTGQVEEIAETVLFLLSERASFTTGQTLVVDGGRVTLP